MARITLIATGGVRAPTQLELADRFVAGGHEVRCIATTSALRFLIPHLLRHPSALPRYARLYRTRLRHELAYLQVRRRAPHIEEATWADVIVIAPATCNSVGKLAAGVTDSLALLVARAAGRSTRVIVVPSMNTEMWFDPLFQRSVDLLNETEKYHVLSPSEGEMLSGDVGWGAQVSLDAIVAATYHAIGQADQQVEQLLRREDGCVVLVDEDERLRGEIATALARDLPSVRIEQFELATQALAWLHTHRASVVVTELTFSRGVQGSALIDRLRRLGGSSGVHVVAISALGRAAARAEELAQRNVHFQAKPLNIAFLVGVVAGCIRRPHERGVPAATIRLDRGETLFREGDAGTHLYLIESGHLQVLRQVGGRVFPIGRLGPGAVVGEMAFFGKGVRSATVVADDDAVVAEIDLDDVRDYLLTQPVWLRELITSVTDHLHRLEETALSGAGGDSP